MSDIEDVQEPYCTACGEIPTPNLVVQYRQQALCPDCYAMKLVSEDHMNFVKVVDEKMETVEPDLIHYRGRFYYEGPAIIVHRSRYSEAKRILDKANVSYREDNMGLDYVIYPD